MKIIRPIFFLIILLSTTFFVSSCSSEKKEQRRRIEATKIIEGRSCKDLLNDLYMSADGDEQSLARILNVTPSVINRIRNGITKPSIQFEDRVRDVAIYYQMNGKNFYRLRSNFDPKWKPIIDTIGHLPQYNPFLFWLILILLVGGMLFCLLVWFFHTWPLFAISIAFWLLMWVLSAIFTPREMDDPYIDTINPIVEQVL